MQFISSVGTADLPYVSLSYRVLDPKYSQRDVNIS